MLGFHVASYAQIPLGSSRHVSTRHDMFGVSRASKRACRAVLFDKLDIGENA